MFGNAENKALKKRIKALENKVASMETDNTLYLECDLCREDFNPYYNLVYSWDTDDGATSMFSIGNNGPASCMCSGCVISTLKRGEVKVELVSS